MPTLKEIKTRIGSVRSTLKITSAMRLVSSAKLHKAQQAIEAMRPYQALLQGMLSRLLATGKVPPGPLTSPRSGEETRVAVVALSSNSSLCGGFNMNVITRTRQLLKEHPSATVFSIGRKMADAMRKAGYPSPEDFSSLSEHPSYEPAAELAGRLMKAYADGEYDRIYLVYNHFVSTAKQMPVVETYLPVALSGGAAEAVGDDAILEPDAPALVEEMLPKTVRLGLYTALLDSAAAEHAARTVAMQAATDNGNTLLDELTLAYNKSRQQKITSEILDLAGGRREE